MNMGSGGGYVGTYPPPLSVYMVVVHNIDRYITYKKYETALYQQGPIYAMQSPTSDPI